MSHHHKPAANQYVLDFESARNGRYAQLMSVVEACGLVRQKELARLLFNVSESQGGEAVGYSMDQYAAAIGESRNTARRWLRKLADAGLVRIEERTRERGGCRTNLVAIAWEHVRHLAVNRGASCEARGARTRTSQLASHNSLPPHSYRAPIFAHRAPTLVGRPPNLGAPIRNPISLPQEVNTTTTYALPHAQPLPHAVILLGNEEEEGFVKKLASECRQRIRNCPRLLETAIRRALASGCSQEQVWNRCKWFAREQTQWQAEHRPGVLFRGLADAQPELRDSEGWPYQRS